MTREDAIRKANVYYERKRNEESVALEKREAEVREKYPEIGELLSRRARLPIECLKSAMNNKEAARSISEKLKNDGLALNISIRYALKAQGLDENYLKMHYECETCRDTGYIKDSIPAKTCPCFDKRVLDLMRSDTPLSFNSFSDFDVNRVPETEIAPGITQRALTLRIKQACEDYAKDYPNTFLPNLLLTGQTGLGKSFLMSCIISALQEKGVSCMYVSSYRLFEIMRGQHFHEEGTQDDFDVLLNCPALFIDDLGSEPILKNISSEYLCVLLEARMNSLNHTVITSNLTPPQFNDKYGERIMSRLSDKTKWDHLRLEGKDLRRA